LSLKMLGCVLSITYSYISYSNIKLHNKHIILGFLKISYTIMHYRTQKYISHNICRCMKEHTGTRTEPTLQMNCSAMIAGIYP